MLNSQVIPSVNTCKHGIFLDNELYFSPHISNLSWSCSLLFYNWPFLSIEATQCLFSPKSYQDCSPATWSWQFSLTDSCNWPRMHLHNWFSKSFHTPHQPIVAFPPLACCSWPHQSENTSNAKNGPIPTCLKALINPCSTKRSLLSL